MCACVWAHYVISLESLDYIGWHRQLGSAANIASSACKLNSPLLLTPKQEITVTMKLRRSTTICPVLIAK